MELWQDGRKSKRYERAAIVASSATLVRNLYSNVPLPPPPRLAPCAVIQAHMLRVSTLLSTASAASNVILRP